MTIAEELWTIANKLTQKREKLPLSEDWLRGNLANVIWDIKRLAKHVEELENPYVPEPPKKPSA